MIEKLGSALYLLIIFLFSQGVFAQDIPYHQSNTELYSFLEELATLKVIQLNSAVLPLSRAHIHGLLATANENRDQLNKRQLNDLKFFQQEFIKEDSSYRGLDFIGKGLKGGGVFPLRKRTKRHDLFHYKDSLFNITLNARVGGEGWQTHGKYYYQRALGASLFGSIGKHFGFYANLTDHNDSEVLSGKTYLHRRLGANYKNNLDFSEMRGGITAAVKWGSLSIVKDHATWGTAYNGTNIFSGRTPSFPMIKLHLQPVKWFSFDYMHAWLVSGIPDSLANYQSGPGSQREIMRSKYMAANMFTVRPFKGFHLSLGNSVVYSDQFNAVYLIPFLFFKSVDHTLNNVGTGSNSRGQNSQMFVNIVSRQIKYLQLYTSLFIDEIRLSTMFDQPESRNHLSWKAGLRFTAPKNINASLIFEYTRTNPIAFRHFINTTTFESNGYNMGHNLRDNAEEYHVAVLYRPLSKMTVNAGFTYVRKGPEYEYLNGSDGEGLPFLGSVHLYRYQANVTVGYQVSHEINVKLTYQYLKETGIDAYRYVPPVKALGPHSFSFGLMIGI